MKINLTKLLDKLPDYRIIGTTGDYGIKKKAHDKTSIEDAYAFELESLPDGGKNGGKK